MAYETGTATDHLDLYNKLFNFLTSNSSLQDNGETWEEVWTHEDASHPVESGGKSSQFMLKGPGKSGEDEIFVSFSLEEDSSEDIYGLWLCGCDGVVSSAPDFEEHLNPSDPMWMPMHKDEMSYWFVANGRRFVVVCKISSVYEACSAGLFLPYCMPDKYPYPAYVGGSSEEKIRYSTSNSKHTHFIDPGPHTFEQEDEYDGGDSLRVRLPGGEWHRFRNYSYEGHLDSEYPVVYPYIGQYDNDRPPLLFSRTVLGGDHMLFPVVLLSDMSDAKGALGFFQGVNHVTGFDNSAENKIEIDGVEHLVVQNVYRTAYSSYWTLALE